MTDSLNQSAIPSASVNHDFWDLNTAKPVSDYEHIDFKGLNESLRPIEPIAKWLCPGGKMKGMEYVSLNPTRPDNAVGSFSINVKTGKWGDFALGHFGWDIISYCAYVKGLSQSKAALFLRAVSERRA